MKCRISSVVPRTPHVFFSALLAVCAISSETLGAKSQRTRLVVLDNADDGIDGAELQRTVEAYVAEIEIEAILVTTDLPIETRDVEVARATAVGKQHGARVVLWIEPADGASEEESLTLVLLDMSSHTVIALPIALGERGVAAMLRVLAATTRMIFDMEMLNAIEQAENVSQVEPTPQPWPAPPNRYHRSLETSAGYLGALSLGDATVLHGARLGVRLRLSELWLLGLDVGYLATPKRSIADIRFREQRLPLRLGVGAIWSVGRTQGTIIASLRVEPVWLKAEPSEPSSRQEIDPFGRLDAGGDVDFCWRFPIVRKLWFFASVGAAFQAINHYYVRAGETAVDSSCCRIEWSAGFTLFDL